MVVVAELAQLLAHQWDAVAAVDARLATLEVILDDGSPEAVTAGVDAVRRATERASALALTRSLALAAVGASPDLPAEGVSELLGGHGGPDCHRIAQQLSETVQRANRRRERITRILAQDGRCPGRLGPPLRA